MSKQLVYSFTKSKGKLISPEAEVIEPYRHGCRRGWGLAKNLAWQETWASQASIGPD